MYVYKDNENKYYLEFNKSKIIKMNFVVFPYSVRRTSGNSSANNIRAKPV